MSICGYKFVIVMMFPLIQCELLVEGLLVLVEQDLPSGGCSTPVIALKMGKLESKALDLSVTNWSSQVSYSDAFVSDFSATHNYRSLSIYVSVNIMYTFCDGLK